MQGESSRGATRSRPTERFGSFEETHPRSISPGLSGAEGSFRLLLWLELACQVIKLNLRLRLLLWLGLARQVIELSQRGVVALQAPVREPTTEPSRQPVLRRLARVLISDVGVIGGAGSVHL